MPYSVDSRIGLTSSISRLILEETNNFIGLFEYHKMTKKNASPRRKQSRVSLTFLHGKGSQNSLRTVNSLPQMKLQTFREAFKVIDQDGDGVITKEDLKSTCATYEIPKRDSELDEMLNEVSGPINQAKFSSLLASRAGDVDDAQILLNAFSILDKEGRGKIPVRELCSQLSTIGFERMTSQEINALLKVAPVDSNGFLDYKQFVQLLHGEPQEQ